MLTYHSASTGHMPFQISLHPLASLGGTSDRRMLHLGKHRRIRLLRHVSSTASTAVDNLYTALPPEQLQRNLALVERLRGKLILAPLTRGGNLPFRRLCAEFGADVTMGEMAFARHLLKGEGKERAMLRKAPKEDIFGVQIATNQIDEGVKASMLAAEAGASWIDLNCGCPIYEATRRGLGSALLRRPKKLARLVNGIASESPLPLTVKIRLGINYDSINVEEVTELLAEAGAAAVTIHGRTAEQRYKKSADWDIIDSIARKGTAHVIGNGDILTHYEASKRLADHDCLAVMVGRGALIRPWIFQEKKEGKDFDLSSQERVAIYRQLALYMREHFRDDERGKKRAFYFLPWHFNFFHRHRYLPQGIFEDMSGRHPLISTRWESVLNPFVGEHSLEDLSPLERLLRCDNEEAHVHIANALWHSTSDDDAVRLLGLTATEHLEEWERVSHPCTLDEREAEG